MKPGENLCSICHGQRANTPNITNLKFEGQRNEKPIEKWGKRHE